MFEAAGQGSDNVYASVDYSLAAGQEIEYLRVRGTAGLSLTGNELDNFLIGSSGSDTLNGGGGDDRLNGGAGADVMAGGGGDDRYYVDNAADQVLEAASEGSDDVFASVDYSLAAGLEIEYLRVRGTAGLSLTGNELDNVLVGNSGSDTLNGGGGDDRLDGGGGADTLAGGGGDDRYYVDNAGDQVLEATGQGSDDVYASVDYSLAAGLEVEYLRVRGSAGLSLTGNELATYLIGGVGNDTLDGGAGADILVGGAGNDRYDVDNVGDEVREAAGEGSDDVYASVNYTLAAGQHVETLRVVGSAGLSLTGNERDNDLIGNSGNDTLNGGGGDDELDGGGGADAMTGGSGNDTYYVDNAGDQVFEAAGEGSDDIYASVNYTLAAGQEVEILRVSGAAGLTLGGNGFDNSLVGGSGDDTLDGGSGADTLTGGAGDDLYYVDNVNDTVVEVAGEGSDEVYASVNYNLAAGQRVETLRVFGSAGLILRGNELNNTLVGGSGDDTLEGGTGNDTIQGGDGNDSISTDGQSAVIDGGTGNDSIRLDGTSSSTGTVDGGTGSDTVRSADLGQFVISNAEILDTYYGFFTGSIAQIASFGTYTADLGAPDTQIAITLRGAGGTLDFTTGIGGQNSLDVDASALTSAIDLTGSVNGDAMFGSAFGDILRGGNGNDTLSGAEGDDTLVGGTANDLLNGGAGNDQLTGGGGSDVFAFDSPISGGNNIDVVADFSSGSDTLQLDQTNYFVGLSLGQLDAAQFAVGTATGAGPQIVYDQPTGALFYDSNGATAGGASQFATLTGSPTLTAADILIV